MEDALTPDEAARLYERYGYFLLRRCRTVLRDPAAAEDAVQQVFEKLLRAGGAIRRADHPLRWLYRVADRCCFDLIRRRRRRPEAAAPRQDGGATAHPDVDLEARDVALKLLATMSEEEMAIAVLLFVDGLSQGEIAAEVGLSRVTVNKKVQGLRARAERALGRAS